MRAFCKKIHAGFTLVELLAVVAIIGVLVAVAITHFSASVDKAQAAVCMANTRSLKGMLTKSYLLDENVQKTFDNNVNNFKCPKGGVISYSYDEKAKCFIVRCSIHNTISAFDQIYLNYAGNYKNPAYSQFKDKEGSAANKLYNSLSSDQQAFLDQYVWNITGTQYGIRIFFMEPEAFNKLGSNDGQTYYAYKYDPVENRYQLSVQSTNKGRVDGQQVLTGNAGDWGFYDSDGKFVKDGWMDALPADLSNPKG